MKEHTLYITEVKQSMCSSSMAGAIRASNLYIADSVSGSIRMQMADLQGPTKDLNDLPLLAIISQN